ncbi:nuclear transport factor 2 family protein [Stenomitos frigidus]|uniref:SnoaL-like domain-containing protein n=2 Tax=Stenomitos TaxID=1844270 RepID=A0A2T1DUB1_9CYAN|nr:hypothetical protein C7B82_28525 [Stenomitos frigidus ULC18]
MVIRVRQSQMVEHSNAVIIRRGYEAFASADSSALMSLITEDAVWHSPGNNLLSGDYQGVVAILGYFAKFATLSQGKFQVTVQDVFANDNRAVVLTRDTATRNGRTLSWEGGVIFQLQTGRLQEAWAFNLNQSLVDAFWS